MTYYGSRHVAQRLAGARTRNGRRASKGGDIRRERSLWRERVKLRRMDARGKNLVYALTIEVNHFKLPLLPSNDVAGARDAP